MSDSDELKKFHDDFAQILRLALSSQPEDVRLYAARLVRRYRSSHPELAKEIETHLRSKQPRGHGTLRKNTQSESAHPFPMDDESRLSLLKVYADEPVQTPFLSDEVEQFIYQLIHERNNIETLRRAGLTPTKSAIFVGKPGLGKTLTSQWLASQLNMPLYVLDLTAVMSSLLGRSGSNLRAALDYARRSPCILLLDEIDSIAKKRSDESDIGELKRLVTVILQEVENWPATGLLLAATNHPELIDPALWRRFDQVVQFEEPNNTQIITSLNSFLGSDRKKFEKWIEILGFIFDGYSYSDIQREANKLRRSLALKLYTEIELVENLVQNHSPSLDQAKKIDLAVMLHERTRLSQHKISSLTGVSRDTIRKHSNSNDKKKPLTSRRTVKA
jgi:SpoVK/Ycf46/Vps4 family AAA+-type ATPase